VGESRKEKEEEDNTSASFLPNDGVFSERITIEIGMIDFEQTRRVDLERRF
jgi:hypothetical protein